MEDPRYRSLYQVNTRVYLTALGRALGRRATLDDVPDGEGQCFVRLPFADLAGRSWRLTDEVGSAVYERDGDDLQGRGLSWTSRRGRRHFLLRSGEVIAG